MASAAEILPDGVEIGATALPDELFGLPVTVIGDHALAPAGYRTDGEEVMITCGPLPADAEWNNRKIQQLTLPRHTKQIMNYAMMSCDNLRVLNLHDGIQSWYSGCLMNCHKLSTFILHEYQKSRAKLLNILTVLCRMNWMLP